MASFFQMKMRHIWNIKTRFIDGHLRGIPYQRAPAISMKSMCWRPDLLLMLSDLASNLLFTTAWIVDGLRYGNCIIGVFLTVLTFRVVWIRTGFLGNAGVVEVDKLQSDYEQLLGESELIEVGFKVIRDTFVFTNKRLIIINIQGILFGWPQSV